MNKYELTTIISGKATPAKKKSFSEKVKKLVESYKGKIVSVDDWGKIDLMYKIDANSVGNFYLFNIELNAKDLKSLNDKLKMDNDVIRFLIVKA